MTFSYRPIVVFLMCVVLGLAIGCGGGTMGTQTGERTFDGTVLDDAGQPIVGLQVSLRDPNSGEEVATVITDGDGKFSAVADVDDSVLLEFSNTSTGATGQALLDVAGETDISLTAVVTGGANNTITVVVVTDTPTPTPTAMPSATNTPKGSGATATPTAVSEPTEEPATATPTIPGVPTIGATGTPTAPACTSDCDAEDPTPTPQPTAPTV